MERTSNEAGGLEVKYEIIIRPEAQSEVQAAFDWYEEQIAALQSVRRKREFLGN